MANPHSPLTLYHNPRCSKSRKAHELLTAELGEGQFRVVSYLDEPLTKDQLATLLTKLSCPVAAIVREADAAKHGIEVATASDDQLLTALVHHPGILQRPLAENATTALVGRPPERVLELL